MDNEQRRYERALLNFLDEAEAEGHPYPELVAIERFMKMLRIPREKP